jgi:hypothetical protein
VTRSIFENGRPRIAVWILIHYQHDPVQTTKTSVHGAIKMLGLAKRVGAAQVLPSLLMRKIVGFMQSSQIATNNFYYKISNVHRVDGSGTI